jgi:hypothetical protein
MALHLKFLPEHVSRLGLDVTPKQRLSKQRNDWSSKEDDIGYDSGRESCISTVRRDRLKTLSRKRGVRSRYQGVEVTWSSLEDKDACEVPAQDVCLFNLNT